MRSTPLRFISASRLCLLVFSSLVLVPLLAACDTVRPIVPLNGGGGAGGATASSTGGADAGP